MMRVLVAMLLLLPTLAAATKIYKHVAPDGTVIFSDQPIDEAAQEMNLPPISVVETDRAEPRPRGGPDQERDADQPVRYRDFRIVAPQEEEAFFGPAGPVAVTVQTSPALADGDQFRYFLDDRQVAETRTPFLSLEDLYRGEHNLRAEIIDESGRVKMSTGPVTFYILRPGVGGG